MDINSSTNPVYTREELETLYNDTVYPHIQSTGGKIASYYRHKHREDYEDILQLISMDMWRVLEKLLLISENSQFFMRILTSAINFSFRTHYGKLKRTYYVPNRDVISLDEFEVTCPSDVNKLNILVDMSDVTGRIMRIADSYNRFTGNERNAVDFCLKSLLLGREPGEKIIRAFYEVDDPSFMIDYARYLIRLSILNIYHTVVGA
jgi:hypothetical protein